MSIGGCMPAFYFLADMELNVNLAKNSFNFSTFRLNVINVYICLTKIDIILHPQMTHKGKNNSVKMQKDYFCNGTKNDE